MAENLSCSDLDVQGRMRFLTFILVRVNLPASNTVQTVNRVNFPSVEIL